MILKNGKRIDGCTDTLPVGTVQPFLGLTPPLGYLICQGQLISKVEYPELYNICKSTFGTETETHFYLPDLRGKTIAGYDSSDSAMNTIGKLLGAEEHKHLTPISWLKNGDNYWHGFTNEYGYADVAYKTFYGSQVAQMGTVPSNATNLLNYYTDVQSNYQPTMVMNWIVKAAMLIPEYFTVENTLTSTNTSNALSAAQGKILNDSKLSLSGGTMTGMLRAPWTNLVNNSNEVNFTGAGYNRDTLWLNYRGGDGSYTATAIKGYSFGNGQGSTSGVTLVADNFNGLAAKATADANGNVITSSYMPNAPICVGSQIIHPGFSGSGLVGKTALIGSYGTSLIDGITSAVPSGYHVEYRLSMQVTTSGNTTVNLFLNSKQLCSGQTWSGATYRIIRTSDFFTTSEIGQETTYGYSNPGINLYYSVTGDSNYSWQVWNITIHAYLVRN